MKILIATDGSPFGEAAVQAAKDRPWPRDSELRVISVIEHLPLAVAGTEYTLSLTELLTKMRDTAEQIASSAAESLRGNDRVVSYIVREGSAAEEILNEACDWNADLIIVGTHGRRGLSRFLLGSVAERVTTHAPCSVEIVRKSGISNEK